MLAERVFWTPIFIETTQFYHYSYYIVEETQVQRWERASQVALAVKNPLANAADMRDVGLIPGSGRSPAGGNGNLCLEKPMDRGTYQATVHGILPHKFTQVILDFSLGFTLKKAVSTGG